MQEISQQLQTLAQLLIQRNYKLALAESCTGGWIAQVVTSMPGSSQWFDRGFVTYSNAAKCEMLGVPDSLIEQYGAVSEPVVKAMAEGAVRYSQAQVSIAVTGIAGPEGGTLDKPVGTVWLGWATPEHGVITQEKLFLGDRQSIRWQAVQFGVQYLLELYQ